MELVVKLIKKIKKITIPLKHIFHKKCPDCADGYLIQYSDLIGCIEFNVYICNKCNKKFV